MLIIQSNDEASSYIKHKYRYIKRVITGNRGNIASKQVSEFNICDNNGNVMSRPSGTTITCDHSYSDMQTYGPQKLIDNSVYTKWYVETFDNINIIIDLGTEIEAETYGKYKRYTANDEYNRDPTSWSLMISNDGINYKTVSTVSNYSVTTSRLTQVGIRDFSL